MNQKSCYSSNVVLTLVVAGIEIAISHLSSDFMIIRNNKAGIGESHADLIVQVDDRVKAQKVFLPHGIPAGNFIQVTYL